MKETDSMPPIKEEFKVSVGSIPGVDAEALLRSLETPPEVSLRINSRKRVSEALYEGMTPVEWCSDGYYLSERPAFTQNPLLHAGVFYVQDASSMIYQWLMEDICRRLGDRGGLCVLDMCAAPGGKTTASLNALPDGAVVIANEFSRQRARILQENLVKYGYPGVAVTNADAQAFGDMEELFDIVTIDAPCSGEGMMRKESVARTQWSESLVASCAALQREIVKAGVRALRPGGYMLYSTCTFNLSEDEEIVKSLIEEEGMEPVAISLPDGWKIPHGCKIPHGIALDGDERISEASLRFMPHITKGEGLFVAMLRKPGNDTMSDLCLAQSGGKRNAKGKKGAKQKEMVNTDSCKGWISDSDDYEFVEQGGRIMAVPSRLNALVKRLPEKVSLMSAGVEVAKPKGRDLVPSHPLALSTALARETFPTAELEEAQALGYLSREAIVLPPDTPKGFVIVTYKGYPLGFVKNLGNRANNLYPEDYRIRNRK